MSDSSNYSNMSDLDDIKYIELVMQLNQGESSSRSCKAINRDRYVAEARCDYEMHVAIRQLAYDTSPDALDEYLQMGEHCARDCLDCFTMCIIDLFTHEFLRKPDVNDVCIIDLFYYGLSGMLGSIDRMHWEWINCPKAWHGQFGRGANHDLTVLNHSSLFDDLFDDIAPIVPFEVNGVTFEKGYYLTDGIYPQWAAFVKSFMVARDERNAVFKRRQECARKDVERAFGVLQGRAVYSSLHCWILTKLRRTMYTCIILHK
ncbi:ALP1-like protein isoform X1 [Tanacetum coccineum]